jgi:2-polyprenyl-3-methyl-5-hydroxy-6-metoxy-1,4-benzoquinol methylase
MKPLKRLERYITAFFKLGRTEWMAKQSFRMFGDVEKRLDHAEGHGRSLQHSIDELRGQLEWLKHDLDKRVSIEAGRASGENAALARSISDITRRLDTYFAIAPAHSASPTTTIHTPHSALTAEGFSSFKDTFYYRLEQKYRGSREEIANRLRVYLPDVEAAIARTDGMPALDIGCGRGEWLELLKHMDIDAKGIDINAAQLEDARAQDLNVELADVFDFLSAAADNSLSVISAHHVIEHLPFDMVAWITREAMRVLAPGGLLLFETPNTRNVLVGATTFHTDPTHLKPMPEQVLGVLFETAGYHPVDIRQLSPHERLDEFLANPDFNDELAFLLFGPQDLAILGTKPCKE